MGNDFGGGVWGGSFRMYIKVYEVIFLLGSTNTCILKGR